MNVLELKNKIQVRLDYLLVAYEREQRIGNFDQAGLLKSLVKEIKQVLNAFDEAEEGPTDTPSYPVVIKLDEFTKQGVYTSRKATSIILRSTDTLGHAVAKIKSKHCTCAELLLPDNIDNL